MDLRCFLRCCCKNTTEEEEKNVGFLRPPNSLHPLFLLLTTPPRSLPPTSSPLRASAAQLASDRIPLATGLSSPFPPTPSVVSTQQTLAASDNSLFRHAAVSRDEALVLYEDMVLGRVFGDTCAQMYYLGKMFGFVHLYYNGQEAVSTGFIKLLEARDSVVSTYRDHVHGSRH